MDGHVMDVYDAMCMNVCVTMLLRDYHILVINPIYPICDLICHMYWRSYIFYMFPLVLFSGWQMGRQTRARNHRQQHVKQRS